VFPIPCASPRSLASSMCTKRLMDKFCAHLEERGQSIYPEYICWIIV
jgi:hypothetical protein